MSMSFKQGSEKAPGVTNLNVDSDWVNTYIVYMPTISFAFLRIVGIKYERIIAPICYMCDWHNTYFRINVNTTNAHML